MNRHAVVVSVKSQNLAVFFKKNSKISKLEANGNELVKIRCYVISKIELQATKRENKTNHRFIMSLKKNSDAKNDYLK